MKPHRKSRKPSTSQPNPSQKSSPKTLWAVMKAHNWSSLEIQGIPLQTPPSGPCRFIPVFDSHEAALAWNGGCEDHITELSVK